MILDDKTYEMIKECVANMYEFCEISKVPIDVFDIARKEGLKVVPYSSMDESAENEAWKYDRDGFLVILNGVEGTIYYNDIGKEQTRINQTIMHEIGHFILGHASENESEEEAAEAKFFAKYSLAPMPLIHMLIEKKSAENIRKRFGIGIQASQIAFENYISWLHCSVHEYTDYELKILHQFGFSD